MILLELIFILIIPAYFWSPVVYHEAKFSHFRRIVCNPTEAASKDILCASHQICVLAAQNQGQDQLSRPPFNAGLLHISPEVETLCWLEITSTTSTTTFLNFPEIIWSSQQREV